MPFSAGESISSENLYEITFQESDIWYRIDYRQGGRSDEIAEASVQRVIDALAAVSAFTGVSARRVSTWQEQITPTSTTTETPPTEPDGPITEG